MTIQIQTPSGIGTVTICLSPVELADKFMDFWQRHHSEYDTGGVDVSIDWDAIRDIPLSDNDRDGIESNILVYDNREWGQHYPRDMRDKVIDYLTTEIFK